MYTKPGQDLIAPCGMNCSVCRFYLSKAKGLYKSKNAGCVGCIPRGIGCNNHGGCEPLKAKAVRFCYECTAFPCENMKKLEKRYSTKYHTSLIDNLMSIKENGIDKWLAGEESRWKCKKCGGTVSIHTHTCFDCGK